MKTPAEKTLARKVASDALGEVVIAKEVSKLCEKNLKTQQAVKKHTDKIVKLYEAGKNAQVAKHGKEVVANKHAVASAKQKAATALAQAKCAADKKTAKKALNTAKSAEKAVSKHVAGVDKAIGASGQTGNPTAGEQDTATKTDAAKVAARKHGHAAGLASKAKKIAATIKDPKKKQLANQLVVKARAAMIKAGSAHSDAKNAAHKSAGKNPSKAKAAHDHAKIKKETEIQYKLGQLEAVVKAVARDMAVVVKLKTADAAQAAADMKQLSVDLKKTPKEDVTAKQKAKLLLAQAKAAQKLAVKASSKARKAEMLAMSHATTAQMKTSALDLMKKTEDEEV